MPATSTPQAAPAIIGEPRQHLMLDPAARGGPNVSEVTIRRLGAGDILVGRAAFSMMVEVFGEGAEPLDDDYVGGLLIREAFWVLVARVEDEVIGAITAHTLPMTRSPTSELFVYDLAVRTDHQRRGIGRRLVLALCEAAERVGIDTVFVPADNDGQRRTRLLPRVGGRGSARHHLHLRVVVARPGRAARRSAVVRGRVRSRRAA